MLKFGFRIPVDTWNVATGSGVSTKEFIEAARQVSGKDIPICFDIKSSLKTAWEIAVKRNAL